MKVGGLESTSVFVCKLKNETGILKRSEFVMNSEETFPV